LDVLRREGFSRLRGRRLGVLCHQASIAADYKHIVDLLLEQPDCDLQAIYGPQHGLHGHTQDNMIEWEGFRDRRTGLPVYSLYGKHRQPPPEMLAGLDALIVDLQDVGSRYYTFIWTMALCMRACEPLGIEMIVLDRPNPIGGLQQEGPFPEPGYESFVGLHPLLIRHALTIGEIARHLQSQFYPQLQLEVVEMEGWERWMYWEDTGLPWAMPSPNMPTVDTAVVYPGGCLLEGTMLSEGRGTTQPFETFGAPYMDAHTYAAALNGLELPGVVFRPVYFEPTFQKHARQLCGGVFVHVTDRKSFLPVLTYVAAIREARAIYGDQFAWRPPPYEYEERLMPFDILIGNSWLREMIDAGAAQEEITRRLQLPWVESSASS
jgi:uncharacterized protein YbbC (DUF1343 family)